MWIDGTAALWGFQLLHGLFGGWRRHGQVSLAKVLMICPLVFLSSWLLLTPVLALAAWVYWIGDNNHWFWDSLVRGWVRSGDNGATNSQNSTYNTWLDEVDVQVSKWVAALLRND